MFVAAFKIGITPNQFWDMTLDELFLLVEASRPRVAGDYQGNLTGESVSHLSERSEIDDEKWWKLHGPS